MIRSQKLRKGEKLSKLAKRVRPKTLKSLKKIAWTLCSKVVRTTYADHRGFCTCYTCGNSSHVSEMQAGHAIGGRHNQVLFDETILRVQCVRCNVFLRGNYPVFTTKLIRENGIDWWEGKLRDSHAVKIYKRDDFVSLIESYRERLKALESHYTDVPFGGTT
jgi:hypothetical protein